jgi:GT2 family glycosyltransferase
MPNITIATLITCYNRKQQTLDSLKSLFSQNNCEEVSLCVYLVDDGSTDGTTAAVKESYPQVRAIEGDGNLFWNRGMHKAFAEAMPQDYDYYLWLNDDTQLYPDAISKLLRTSQQLTAQGQPSAIVAGSTQDPERGRLTYGGAVSHRWWHPLSFLPIPPTENPQSCDVINGNCVLIPRSVVEVVGNLDLAFAHYLGDYDYALRARKQNCSVWIAPGYVGTCPANLSYRNSQNVNTSLSQQLEKIDNPKGLPTQDLTLYSFKEWQIFSHRHGGLFWFFYYLVPYRRLLSPFKSKNSSIDSKIDTPRIAWLVPSAIYGAYWPPILHALSAQFEQLIFYTGQLWPKFDPATPGTSVIQVVGQTQFIEQTQIDTGYSRGFLIVSPAIIMHLLQFRPQVVFASGFSLWTLFAILLKPLGWWRLILVYEGSAPNVDFRDSRFRLFFRRWMVKFADAFVSNSQSGKDYLTEILGVMPTNIYARPYMVPDKLTADRQIDESSSGQLNLRHPVFLFVGQVIHRKGLHLLLAACVQLQARGDRNFTLLVVGDGAERQELEEFSLAQGLSDRIRWLGWVAYDCLGAYFQAADVFVFPTLEDTWGMVTLEAMACGKPVICSKWAGTAEMTIEGETGYSVDPHNIEELANAMSRFIDNPELITMMGKKSYETISAHTPEIAAKFLADVTISVLS